MLPKGASDRVHRAAGRLDDDIDVLIVDDHPGVRSAIESLVGRTPGLRVVGSVCSGAAAIEGVARLQPTVVVMDLGLSGINGVEATARSARGRRRRWWSRSQARASCGAKPEPLVRHTRS